MATTTTNIKETLIHEPASTAGAGNAGNAAGAYSSDEEILGIGDAATDASAASATLDVAEGVDPGEKDRSGTAEGTESAEKTKAAGKTEGTESGEGKPIPAEFAAIFAAEGTGPKLRDIFQREAEYREMFPSVNEARAAVHAQRELARVDELFDSGDPAAHVELMAGLAQRDPAAFRSLAATFGERLAEIDPQAFRVISGEFARAALEAVHLPEQIDLLARAAEKGDAGAVKFLADQVAGRIESLRKVAGSAASAAGKNQVSSFVRPAGAAAGRFVESVNANVERGVAQAVGGRVAELLPDAPEATRHKIAADIYRELDAALKKDSALLQQVTANFQAAHQAGQFGEPQKAVMAALVMSKAKALLPGVAKRVVGDWTAAVMSASQARRAKQGAAAGRADVGVGGAPRPVSTQAARVNYGKMSDEEILNAE